MVNLAIFLKEYHVPYTFPINTRPGNPGKQILHTADCEWRSIAPCNSLLILHLDCGMFYRQKSDQPKPYCVCARIWKRSCRHLHARHNFDMAFALQLISVGNCNEFGITSDLQLVPASQNLGFFCKSKRNKNV